MKPGLLLLLLLSFTSANVWSITLQIIVLDVGEGQAVLLKRENKGVLIDTGHAGMARTVLNKLDEYGVTRLDHLLLTHLHPDHASGYFRIREAFPNASIYDNGDLAALNSPIDMIRWTAHALADDSNRESIQAGDNIHWMGVVISALWPPGKKDGDLNNNSLVIAIHYCSQNGLIMGDAGRDVESRLLEGDALAAKLELLVAGHHGSAATSSGDFLQHLRPETCIVSVNTDNHRGYPAPNTMRRLSQYCGELSRTDIDGDIVLTWSCPRDSLQ